MNVIIPGLTVTADDFRVKLGKASDGRLVRHTL
jgi:hypothetical protein